MASKDPFNIQNSPFVAPIPCVNCGTNMHCVRRESASAGEKQLFQCSCGNSVERIVGIDVSDNELQCSVEKSFGIDPSSERSRQKKR